MNLDTLKAAVAKVDSMVAPFPTTPVSDAASEVIAYVESLEARIAALEAKQVAVPFAINPGVFGSPVGSILSHTLQVNDALPGAVSTQPAAPAAAAPAAADPAA